MNKKRWIGAAAVFFGLLLAALGVFILGFTDRADDERETEIRQAETAAKPEIYIEHDPLAEEPEPGMEETEASEEDSASGDEPVRMVFAGDILLSDHVLNAYEKSGSLSGVLDPGFQSVIHESDIFMANQEFPFSNRGTAAEDKQFTFRLPPERVRIFQELGLDLVTLANNHALDFGMDALLDTCDTLDQAGIYHVGAGRNLEEACEPVIITEKGENIGFLGASRVIPVGSWNASASKPGMLTTYDPSLLLEQIDHLKETCDYVVVYVHWGIEKKDRPEEYQRSLGKQYIDAGADLVIGSHPHVLQGIEYYIRESPLYIVWEISSSEAVFQKQPCLQQSGTGKPPGFP